VWGWLVSKLLQDPVLEMALSYAEIAAAMNEAVQRDENGVLRKKFNAVVQFNIDDQSPILLDARTESNDRDEEKSPDLTVTTSVTVLQDLLQKKLTPQQAFLKRKIKIKGKMALAMKLSVLLNATRKHLATQTSRL
jgi:putative sterol carrier protein